MRELPKRKPNRLRNYDYSQNGAYFVTVCIKDRHEILGNIPVGATCGRPFPPPPPNRPFPPPNHPFQASNHPFQASTPPFQTVPRMELSEIGKIVETEIAQIPQIFNTIHIPCYVVMPNHVHMIIVIDKTPHDSGRPQVAPCIFLSVMVRYPDPRRGYLVSPLKALTLYCRSSPSSHILPTRTLNGSQGH